MLVGLPCFLPQAADKFSGEVLLGGTRLAFSWLSVSVHFVFVCLFVLAVLSFLHFSILTFFFFFVVHSFLASFSFSPWFVGEFCFQSMLSFVFGYLSPTFNAFFSGFSLFCMLLSYIHLGADCMFE